MSETPSLFAIEPVYCIDTNVIVSFLHEDDDEPYGRDEFAPQWELVERLIAEGKIIAPERVNKELSGWEKEIPDMRAWRARHSHMFRQLTDKTLEFAKRVVNDYPDYGSSDNYIADLEVISLAGSSSLSVVSNERSRPVFSPNRPKIPEICQRFGIDCLSVPGFLRRERRIAAV